MNATSKDTRKSLHPFAGSKDTKARLARGIGPCVHFIRCPDDTIKIGWTSDLAQRKRSFGPGWQHILAIQPGTLADERALHDRFAEHVVSGREYFSPAPPLIAYINEIRDRLGVDALPA